MINMWLCLEKKGPCCSVQLKIVLRAQYGQPPPCSLLITIPSSSTIRIKSWGSQICNVGTHRAPPPHLQYIWQGATVATPPCVAAVWRRWNLLIISGRNMDDGGGGNAIAQHDCGMRAYQWSCEDGLMREREWDGRMWQRYDRGQYGIINQQSTTVTNNQQSLAKHIRPTRTNTYLKHQTVLTTNNKQPASANYWNNCQQQPANNQQPTCSNNICNSQMC